MKNNSLKLDGKVAVVRGASRGIGRPKAHQSSSARGTKMSTMNYQLLGRSGLRVSALCLGAMTFGEDWGWGSPKEEAKKIYDTFREAGGNFIDTANLYTQGTSERFVGEFITFHREEVVLATKYTNAAPGKDANAGGNQRKNMVQALEASTVAVPESAVYSGTKGAVDAITRSLASELGRRGIRVNANRPGMVETEGTRSAGITESEMRKQVETQTPLRRIGQPEDIAGAAVFLASDDSSWVTGETFLISGGYR